VNCIANSRLAASLKVPAVLPDKRVLRPGKADSLLVQERHNLRLLWKI